MKYQAEEVFISLVCIYHWKRKNKQTQNPLTWFDTSCDLISVDLLWRDFIWLDVTWFHLTSLDVTSFDFLGRDFIWLPLMWLHLTSFAVTWLAVIWLGVTWRSAVPVWGIWQERWLSLKATWTWPCSVPQSSSLPRPPATTTTPSSVESGTSLWRTSHR